MFSLNFASREPIYEQLYKNVVRLTVAGILKPDEKLPTVRSLASELGVNPNTISKAYQLLEHDGYIYSMVGRGSFISTNFKKDDARIKIALEKVQTAVAGAVNAGASKEQIYNQVDKAFETEVLDYSENIRGENND